MFFICCVFFFFFFFKQKTAYELRISDWSSDVCSSDLLLRGRLGPHAEVDILEQFVEALGAHGFTVNESATLFHSLGMLTLGAASGAIGLNASEIGRASCRERVCQYVSISVVAVSLKTKRMNRN